MSVFAAKKSLPAAGLTVGSIVLTIAVIIGGALLMDSDDSGVPFPQSAEQAETRAAYIARTALDHSIRALLTDPDWREGFTDVPYEDGTYSARIYDAATDPSGSETLPPNYVRIVATSEVAGVHEEIEAVWVNALSAFDYALSAGDNVEIVSHMARDARFAGDVHNNSWAGGPLRIGDGITIYGNVTSSGEIRIGGTDGDDEADPWAPERNGDEQWTPRSSLVYGDVWARSIDVDRNAEVRALAALSEWTEGIDLNGDGDTRDIDISRGIGRVAAAERIVSAGRPIEDGESDLRLCRGTRAASVGAPSAGPIVDPRPDFAAFYELVTGANTYPPRGERVVQKIRGHGLGHYFASSQLFIDWLGSQRRVLARCWRCAGDGRIAPQSAAPCPACNAEGQRSAIEVAGVFYVDDRELDLGALAEDLIVHGTIVVAMGNPNEWPTREISVPGGTAMINHFPVEGTFAITGQSRPHVTITYRSDEERGRYEWTSHVLYTGENSEVIAVPEPDDASAMTEFPAIVAADRVVIEGARTGFASYAGDIGDEKLTVIQGVVYAEDEVTLHGAGGWNAGAIVFDEELSRAGDDGLDESVLGVDLSGDGDTRDHIEVLDIASVPVIPVSDGQFNVDINNDGVLGKVVLGEGYLEFFESNGYRPPALIYVTGIVLSQSIHVCEQVCVVRDARIPTAGVPFGFDVNFGSTTHQGLVSLRDDHD